MKKNSVFRFAYQIKADIDDSEKWIKLKSWTVECAVAQGDYVLIDLEKKDDSITFILYESYHPFNKNECENDSLDAACFNL